MTDRTDLLRNQPKWTSPAYLAFIRSRPCCVSGAEAPGVVAHHVRCLGGGGISMKPPDWFCVPLTDALHRELHDHGEKTFWAKYGQDPVAMICMNLLVYFAQRPSAKLAVALSRVLTKT